MPASQEVPCKKMRKRAISVRFGSTSTIEYDSALLPGEHELLWHDALELKEQARIDLSRARQLWKQTGRQAHLRHGSTYCWRGLEKRLKSSDASKKKWYKFLHSFLSLQSDIRALNSDNSNLLMIFVSAHSKAGRMQAHQIGLQDEAEAFRVHSESGYSGGRQRIPHAAAAAPSTSSNTVPTSELRLSFTKKLNLEGGPLKSTSGGNTSGATGNQERIEYSTRARSA